METTVSYLLILQKCISSETKDYALCLGNVSKDFTIHSI